MTDDVFDLFPDEPRVERLHFSRLRLMARSPAHYRAAARTETRAMRNYAGHRLSPWLGHLMVSRSETARALLTQGEIMQLPDTEQIVMLAGAPPVHAAKARYYADPRLAGRIGPPVKPTCMPDQPDDGAWHGKIVAAISPPPAPPPPTPGKTRKVASGRVADDGGIRQEPGLAGHEDIAPQPAAELNEFDFMKRQGDDAQNLRNREIDRNMRTVARQASLDPNDGIAL